MLESQLDLQLVVLPLCENSFSEAEVLLDAAGNGYVTDVEALLQLEWDPDLITRSGQRPLVKAARQGHLDVVHLLLEAGADKDLAQNDGSTALLAASRHGRTEIVRVLVESGADLDSMKLVLQYLVCFVFLDGLSHHLFHST